MNVTLRALGAAVVVAWAGAAAAQDHVFKFGHAAASTHLFHDGLTMFADAVAEKTGGRVKIEVFGDRQLGDDRQLLEGLQLGTIDGAVVSAPTMPLVIGAVGFDALQLPFLVDSYDTMASALASPVGQALLDSLDEKNIKGLGYVEAGLRHFLAKPKSVQSVADFAGLKTRIVPVPLHKATWEALGTNPIGMAYGEVYSALETGTIDAVEINLSSIKSESLFQAGKHATLTGHYFWPGVLMMSGPRFAALPDDLKAALVEAGHEVIAAHYAMARDQEGEIAEFLKGQGVSIGELDDLDAMRDLTRPVLDEWMGKDPLIGAFVAAIRGGS
ncbi:MAG: TRAP transporter substrate-binding protein [Gemmobacter sp.]